MQTDHTEIKDMLDIIICGALAFHVITASITKLTLEYVTCTITQPVSHRDPNKLKPRFIYSYTTTPNPQILTVQSK